MKQRATVKIMMSLAAVAMFVLTPSVCAATAQKPSVKKTSLSETELRTLAKTVPDVKNAGQLYSVALATSNDVARQQEYLKAAAAGLIACGKTDIYKKHVKGKLQNAAEFEDELKDDCKQCSGVGAKERRCAACRGKGQCSTCKGTGQAMATASFSFDKQSKPCSKCNESGQCPKCGGEGSTKEKCLTCDGTGKAFSKTVAAQIFRDLCNTIADDMNDAVVSNNVKVDSEGGSNLEVEGRRQQNVVTKDTVDKEPKSSRENGNDGQIVYTDGSIVTIPYGTIKLTRLELRSVDNIPQAHTSRGGGDGNDILKIVIPKSILSIGPNAFYNCENLKSVMIPDSVTNIGSCAFGRCKNLKNVMIPDSVMSIEPYAFQNCENLTSVTIPNSVEYIGRGVFKDCKNLKRVKLPDQLKDIGDSLFLRCLKLESIVIPPGVTNIGSYAFSGCTSLKSVSIPDSVDIISDSAFDETCRLEKSDKRLSLDYFDDDCDYFVDGCYKYDSTGNEGFIYVEDPSGRVNYLFEGHINIRPQAQFPDGRGGVRGAYYVSDTVLFGFPTPEARRLWTHAMHSGCKKMLEWVNTAKENKVGHVEKELPETAFKDGYAYATIDLVPSGAKQKALCYQAIRKGVDNGEFVKNARRIEFKCVIDSRDNTKFNVNLLFGCGGEFPFVLYSCYQKTVDEIQTSVRQFLQKVDPDTLARAWRSQVIRNSLFDDLIAGNDVCNRLAVPKDDISAAKERASYSRELYADFCLSSWYCINSSHEGGRICLAIKNTNGDWNYILFLGENGVAQRQTLVMGTYCGKDFIFDRHLIVFPTKESRNLWYDIMKRSCGKMLEWVALASKKHVPVVVKPIYVAGKGDLNKLVAYYNLITKGRGQDELLKKELRTHIDRLEYEQNGCPLSLICNVMKEKGDSDYKRFKVWIDLRCGDKYHGTIFEASGTYKDIQKECIEFLCKIDPNALIEAWKSKYGRGDLFH